MPGEWRLTLFGEFRLLNPESEEVALPTRKVRGLLAILALAPTGGMLRADLQAELWPYSALEHRQASLRQALTALRKALGKGAVTTTFDRCRLSPSFPLWCDAVEWEKEFQPLNSRAYEIFMPDELGVWFERKRRQYRMRLGGGTLSPPAPTESLPLDGLLQVLRWATTYDPGRALEMLRDHRDLASGLSPRDLAQCAQAALSGAAPNDPRMGWGFYWLGVSVLDMAALNAGSHWLRRAVEWGATADDWTLIVEATFNLGLIQILQARLSSATRTAKSCMAAAERSGHRLLVARASNLAATVLIHRGAVREGVHALERGRAELEESPVEAMQDDALRALYHASIGESESAMRLIESADGLARRSPHVRIDTATLLARALVDIREGSLDAATQTLDRLIVQCGAEQYRHLEIYGRETRARVAWLRRERSGAKEELQTATQLRRSLGMAFTEWDRLRLAELQAG